LQEEVSAEPTDEGRRRNSGLCGYPADALSTNDTNKHERNEADTRGGS